MNTFINDNSTYQQPLTPTLLQLKESSIISGKQYVEFNYFNHLVTATARNGLLLISIGKATYSSKSIVSLVYRIDEIVKQQFS